MKVFFLHSTWKVCALFDGLASRLPAGTDVGHVADDSLIQRLLAAGALDEAIRERVLANGLAACAAGADILQLTCSSLTPCVDALAAATGVAVLSVDEPMMARAVSRHNHIGILATNPATLDPSCQLAAETAAARGRSVEVVPCLVDSAYRAFLAGDNARHDVLVTEALASLAGRVEAICLAQASTQRIVSQMNPGELPVPVYSSPEPAMDRLAAEIAKTHHD